MNLVFIVQALPNSFIAFVRASFVKICFFVGIVFAVVVSSSVSHVQANRDFSSTLAYANWLSIHTQSQAIAGLNSLPAVNLQANIFAEAAHYQIEFVTDTATTPEEKVIALNTFLEKVNNGEIVITERERHELDTHMGSLMGQARTEHAQLREKITALALMRQERARELNLAIHNGMSRDFQKELSNQVAYFDQHINNLQSDFKMWENVQLSIANFSETLGLQMPNLALRQPIITANVATTSASSNVAVQNNGSSTSTNMLGFGSVPALRVDRGDLKTLSNFGG